MASDKKYVFHSNEITQAVLPYTSKYTANTFCFLIANLIKDKKVYKYTLRTIMKGLNVDLGSKRKFLEALDILQSQPIIIKVDGVPRKYSLLSYIEYPVMKRESTDYMDNEVLNELMLKTTLYDSISIKVNPDIEPFLFDLKAEFTSYTLNSFLALSTNVSKRLFQILSQWKSLGKVYFSNDRLQHLLGTKYERITILYNKEIKRALTEISEKTNLTELYATPKKQNRKTIGYTFHFTHIPQQGELAFLPPTTDIKKLETYKRLTNDFSLTPHQATRIINDLPIQDINKELYRIKEMLLNHQIEGNLGGYTYKTFRNKFNLSFH